MSGMLHPVGPEPARTYWIRRGILVAVVLVLALGVVVAVSSLTKAAVATAPPPVIAPAPETASPSPSTPSASTAVSPSAPTTSVSPSAGTSTNPSTMANPSAQPSGSASAAQPSASTPAASSARPSAAPGATSGATPSAKPTAAAPVGTPDCRPSDLRVTLKGDRTLKPGQNDEFTLSLINGSAQTCLASVTDANFELKIYSGTDRIWSSRDCAKVLTDFDKKLAARADVTWTMTWNGERSVPGKSCKTGSDTPRAGTYWATAQLKGADPVQLRMIIS